MKILLVNPPNSGRSIPEEKYGIDSLKMIFKGEPLALEVLAGNLFDHQVRILDLKVEPEALSATLTEFAPDLVGLTGMTCEANSIIANAKLIKSFRVDITVVVGGVHASMDPEYFNNEAIDYVVKGIGRVSFRELVCAINDSMIPYIAGVAKTHPGHKLKIVPRDYSFTDLVDDKPPAYDLVADYRSSYTLTTLNMDMGFVVTAFGCPYRCNFCCIQSLTGGKYITHSVESVIRDIKLLGDIPVVRLLDANTFGNIKQAEELCLAIKEAGIKKRFLADVRSDTVVKYPEMMARWKEAGLSAVIIGFEEVTDSGLKAMNKANKVAINSKAVEILHGLGITIVGDFIISPWYSDQDFDRLTEYITKHDIDLPMITVLTPLPGTKLYQECQHEIKIHDLDYYTLTNSVLPISKMDEADFYQRYATLLREGHRGAKL